MATLLFQTRQGMPGVAGPQREPVEKKILILNLTQSIQGWYNIQYRDQGWIQGNF